MTHASYHLNVNCVIAAVENQIYQQIGQQLSKRTIDDKLLNCGNEGRHYKLENVVLANQINLKELRDRTKNLFSIEFINNIYVNIFG